MAADFGSVERRQSQEPKGGRQRQKGNQEEGKAKIVYRDRVRPGDERQRQRRAEAGRKRPLADLNDGIVAQGRSRFRLRLLAGGET